jgi:hypothetical protein
MWSNYKIKTIKFSNVPSFAKLLVQFDIWNFIDCWNAQPTNFEYLKTTGTAEVLIC